MHQRSKIKKKKSMIRSDEAISRTLEIENTQAKLEESTKTIILIKNNGD